MLMRWPTLALFELPMTFYVIVRLIITYRIVRYVNWKDIIITRVSLGVDVLLCFIIFISTRANQLEPLLTICIWSIVWLLYFFRSHRIRSVYRDKNWAVAT
jgi:hypothetical protein